MQATRGIELFNPQKRFAVLINRWDEPQFFNPPYSRLDAYVRGNKSVFETSAALNRGNLDMTREIRQHLISRGQKEAALRARALDRQVQEAYYAQGGQVNGLDSMVLKALAVYSMVDPQYYRTSSDVQYDELRRVFPDSPDLRPEVYSILSLYQSLADQDSLTLLFIRAHGENGSIAEFKYSDLLDKMDAIQGKKVIVALGCYSGSLIERIKERANPADYAALTSTSALRKGLSWSEDKQLEDLCEHIRNEQPLSEFAARFYSMDGHSQIASLHLPFDVIL